MVLLFGLFICVAYAHGRMTYPPSRNQLAYQRGQDYNPNALHAIGKKCGSIFGDQPYDTRSTNAFPVATQLRAGEVFQATIQITAQHGGSHSFQYACITGANLNRPTGASGNVWTTLNVVGGNGRSATCPSSTCRIEVRSPNESCSHGVLVWNWAARTTNEFYSNCADVSIGGGGSNVGRQPRTPNPLPMPPPSRTPQAPTRRPASPSRTPQAPTRRPTSPGGTCSDARGLALACKNWKMQGVCHMLSVKSRCQKTCGSCHARSSQSSDSQDGGSKTVMIIVGASVAAVITLVAGIALCTRASKSKNSVNASESKNSVNASERKKLKTKTRIAKYRRREN